MRCTYLFVFLVIMLVFVKCFLHICKFEGVTKEDAYCGTNRVNSKIDFVPIIHNFIAHIDLSGQPLKQLSYNAFQNVRSQNSIISIGLENCQIKSVDHGALLNLNNLAFLDVTNNTIVRFESGMFQHTKKLRILNASYNKIKRLQGGLFENLFHLEEVYLHDNHIKHIEKYTFNNTPSLRYINLANNEVQYLDPLFMDKLFNVKYLLLYNNPWNCDCHLMEFVEIYDEYRLDLTQPKCQSPLAVTGKRWIDLASDEFICDPRIIRPTNNTKVVTAGSTITLSCAVYSHPVPDIKWRTASHIIDVGNLSNNACGNIHYLNYTFIVQQHNAGVFYCITGNSNMRLESNITLGVHGAIKEQIIASSSTTNEPITGMEGQTADTGESLTKWILYTLIFVGLITLAVFVVMYTIRKSKRRHQVKLPTIIVRRKSWREGMRMTRMRVLYKTNRASISSNEESSTEDENVQSNVARTNAQSSTAHGNTQTNSGYANAQSNTTRRNAQIHAERANAEPNSGQGNAQANAIQESVVKYGTSE